MENVKFIIIIVFIAYYVFLYAESCSPSKWKYCIWQAQSFCIQNDRLLKINAGLKPPLRNKFLTISVTCW